MLAQSKVFLSTSYNLISGTFCLVWLSVWLTPYNQLQKKKKNVDALLKLSFWDDNSIVKVCQC